MRTYDPPPSDFDPHSAPNRLLRKHGLPDRPDPERDPHLARLWKLAFPGPTTFVKAELAVDPDFRRRRSPTGEVEFTSGDWSGVIALTQDLHLPGESAQWVYTQFVVPYVGELDPIDDDLWVGFWVGLDGILEKQVLQAGISAHLDKGWFGQGWFGGVSYSFWTEWINEAHMNEKQDAPRFVANFPVEAGDTVSVLVCAPQPDLGHVVLGNISQRRMTSISVPADSGISVQGSSAEWIVEGVSAALPFFSPLMFTSCIACTQNHFFDLTNGAPTDAGGGFGGHPITHTSIVSPSIAVVEWEAFA